MTHFLVYVRRSYARASSPDISDEAQVASAVAILPPGATHEVIADSGGHQSGRTEARDGYQELVARVKAGTCDGIAVYDLSRLARRAKIMHDLAELMDRRRMPLLVATMPTTRFDGAVGRMLFGQLALAAQFQADLDSERMTRLMRTLFEDGRHRGQDPFGYRSTRDGEGRRLLVPVPEEAAVVRRVWSDLALMPTESIAERLNAEGVRGPRGAWTKDAVKDVARRGRVYLGLVVEKRGLDERKGRHEPILTPELYAGGIDGMRRRQRGTVRRSPKRRVYLLSGVLYCECGGRMRGETRAARGQEWRYYLCRHCDAPSVPGTIEADTLARIRTMRLPEEAVRLARAELRKRLRAATFPDGRKRIEARMDRLRMQFEWGDLDESTYRARMEDARKRLSAIPSNDRLEVFDRNHRVYSSLTENMDRATPEQLQELVAILVERAVAKDRTLAAFDWVPAARPFFKPSLATAPPDGLEPPVDALEWYAA